MRENTIIIEIGRNEQQRRYRANFRPGSGSWTIYHFLSANEDADPATYEIFRATWELDGVAYLQCEDIGEEFILTVTIEQGRRFDYIQEDVLNILMSLVDPATVSVVEEYTGRSLVSTS